jgi:uncharacterized protein (UPF0212 family)
MNIVRPKPALPAHDFRNKVNIYYPSTIHEYPTCVVCSTQLTDRGLVPNSMKVWRLPKDCEYGSKDAYVWACFMCKWDAEQSWKNDYLVTVTMVVRVHDVYSEEHAIARQKYEIDRGSHGRLVSSQITQIQKEEKEND